MEEERDKVLEYFKSKGIRLKDVYLFHYPDTVVIHLDRFIYRKTLSKSKMNKFLQRSKDLMEQLTYKNPA